MKPRRMFLRIFCFIALGTAVFGQEPIQVRVLSYNIHHAEGVDGMLDLQRIAQVILSAKPHLVALQEVDQNAKRSNSVDQPQELARLTEMNVIFGPNIELQGGHYGNVVLSHFPILRHQNHLLPNVDRGEQRGVIAAEIEIPHFDEPLFLLATHFDHRRADQERVQSAKMINQLILNNPRRAALLAGDINDVVGSETLKVLESQWSHTSHEVRPTIPVSKPDRQIDFIMLRPQHRWKVIEMTVLDEKIASDHRPILAVLELQPSNSADETH